VLNITTSSGHKPVKLADRILGFFTLCGLSAWIPLQAGNIGDNSKLLSLINDPDHVFCPGYSRTTASADD